MVGVTAVREVIYVIVIGTLERKNLEVLNGLTSDSCLCFSSSSFSIVLQDGDSLPIWMTSKMEILSLVSSISVSPCSLFLRVHLSITSLSSSSKNISIYLCLVLKLRLGPSAAYVKF